MSDIYELGKRYYYGDGVEKYEIYDSLCLANAAEWGYDEAKRLMKKI